MSGGRPGEPSYVSRVPIDWKHRQPGDSDRGNDVWKECLSAEAPVEGEAGFHFDEIGNLVEPAERPAMGEPHAGERPHMNVRAGPRAQQDSDASGPDWGD